MAAIESRLMNVHGRIAGNGGMEGLNIELVSGSYFPTLGVSAIKGRVFSDADDQAPEGHPLAVARYSWWNRFAGDPSAVGKTVTIGSTVYTIIGVAAPEFAGVSVGQAPELWIPLAMQKEISRDHNDLEDFEYQSLHIIARMKPWIGLRQAQAHADWLFGQILTGFAGPHPAADVADDIWHARLELTPAATGRSRLRKTFDQPLLILMAVVGLVLLIACANVANLLLVRAAARRREVAVRISPGAARQRLIRQLLPESGLSAVLGALLGIALAWSASRLLLAMVSDGSQLLLAWGLTSRRRRSYYVRNGYKWPHR